MTDFLAGERFGRYHLLRRLAVGGMAEVSLARLDGAAGFNKLVVIKQVLPDIAEQEHFIELFLDEGRLAAQLSHPNIAQTFELGEVDGRYFLAMEYVPGESLRDVDERATELNLPMPLSCALRVVLQCCEALDYAHSARDASGRPLELVHRDVSPSNIVVTWHGSVRLLDFGIARAATQVHRTQAGYTRGKFGFMSPEQCRAQTVDGRTDLYALGAVLYLLVTGKRPFAATGGNLVATVAATLAGDFPPPRQVNPAVHPELEAIILKAMATAHSDRYRTAGELLEALTDFANRHRRVALPRELGEYMAALFPGRATVLEQLEQLERPEAEPHALAAALDTLIKPRLDDGPEPATTPAGPRALDAQAVTGVADSATVTAQGAPLPATTPQEPTAVSAVVLKPPSPFVTGAVILAVGAVIAVGVGIRVARGVERPAVAARAAALRPVQPVERTAAQLAPEPPAEAPPEPPKAATVKTVPAPPKRAAPAPKRAAEPRPASPPPPPQVATGWLKLEAYPWVRVMYRGRELGVTPLRVEVPAGTLELTLSNPEVGLDRKLSVEVMPGRETAKFLSLK